MHINQTMEHATNKRDIILVIDESGSMETMGKEPVQAINAFINKQKESVDCVGSTLSLWKFNHEVVNVIDDQDLQSVEDFTNYTPCGLTALNDAICMAISTKKKTGSYDNVTCVILTDGQENSSSEYRNADVLRMTKEMEEGHNWKFVYLAANQDAFEVGQSYGISDRRCANFTYAPGNLAALARETSSAVSAYRSASINDSKADLTLVQDDAQDDLNMIPTSIRTTINYEKMMEPFATLEPPMLSLHNNALPL